MQEAVDSGFQNSGISCGKKGKIMAVGLIADTQTVYAHLMYVRIVTGCTMFGGPIPVARGSCV